MHAVAASVIAHAHSDPRLASVALTMSGDSLIVLADAAQLEAALLNLVINAGQALNHRGTIEVAIASTGRDVSIEVRDDGPGIPLERHARVFEPFFTTRHQGTGLGLPIVRRVIEGHGGTVTLSCPKAGGTIVAITLPLHN